MRRLYDSIVIWGYLADAGYLGFIYTKMAQWIDVIHSLKSWPPGCFLSHHQTVSQRNWSLFGNIITKQRKRLAPDKAEKLVFIQTNSYLLDEEGQADYLNELYER